MAKDERNIYTIQDDSSMGEVKIADENDNIIKEYTDLEENNLPSFDYITPNQRADQQTGNEKSFQRCESRRAGRRCDSISGTEHEV